MKTLIALFGAVVARENYAGQQVYRVHAPDQATFTAAAGVLASLADEYSLDIWRMAPAELQMDVQTNNTVAAFIEDQMVNKGIPTKWATWIEDVQALIERVDLEQAAIEDPTWHEDYHSYDEHRDFAERVASEADNVDFIASIGQSVEGRDIFALLIKGSGSNKKSIHFQGNIHAREWISPATVAYIAEQLAQNTFEGMESLDILIVPVLNPDGYTWTRENARLWRKNRAVNEGSVCIGVDLNRNWDDHWGGGGSSGNPCSDTYRGATAASEPETRAIVNTVTSMANEWIGGIDFHAYGQLVLRPFGWTLPRNAQPDNEDELKALGDLMRDEILDAGYNTQYTSEHSAELYVAAGGADDWFHTASGGKLGYCFELRDRGNFGFVLPANQIIPSGIETLEAVKAFIKHAADHYVN